jgi:hypothetical protein
VVIGLVAVASLAALAWLQWGVEWVERTVDVGYAEEARRNPYLAAELFLRDRGVDTETVSGLALLDDLPPPDHVLILSSSRRTVSPRRLEALEAWVRKGGHLFVVATEPWDEEAERSRDPLLDALGIRLWPAVEDDERNGDGDVGGEEPADDAAAEPGVRPPEPPDEAEVAPDGTDEEARPPRIGELLAALPEEPSCNEDPEALAGAWYGDTDYRLELELHDERHLDAVDGAEFGFVDDRGSQLVHARIDDGEVTVTTSMGPWRNDSVACHDHALVLWLLTRGRSKVWLMHDPDVPGIVSLVFGALPLTCLAGVVALLTWGTSRSLRFGMRPPPIERARRSWMEHLEAAAGVAWRADRLSGELTSIRRALERSGSPAAGAPGLAPGPGGAATADELADALHGPLPRNRSELVHGVRVLQQIGYGR